MKNIIIGILVTALLICGCITQLPEETRLKINLYENGEVKSLNEIEGLDDILFVTLQKLNLQAKCVFNEERILRIKSSNKVIEIVFNAPKDITISQWVEPEERRHIKTDKNGYRVLENVKVALFILKDNLNEGLEGHVLVGHEFDGKIGYSCWAIRYGDYGEIDKSWVYRVSNLILMDKVS